MMSFSRRQLAHYGVEQLLSGKPAQKVADHLVAALLASGKQKDFELLLSDIDQELEDRGLMARAHVSVAHELTAELERALAANIAKAASVKQVVLSTDVDPSLIGGVRVETANHSWDKSVAASLNRIREAI